MRDPQTTANRHRNPPPPLGDHLKPLSLWERLREGRGRGAGGPLRNLFSPREKIEMRAPLTTANRYRNPPPARQPSPPRRRHTK